MSCSTIQTTVRAVDTWGAQGSVSVGTERAGALLRDSGHSGLSTGAQRLNVATQNGVLDGIGGKLPKARHKATNRGKPVSELVVENRE